MVMMRDSPFELLQCRYSDSQRSQRTGFRIGGCQGMIGQPKFWYGGMLQQAAAGRFLGYGGMRQPGVGVIRLTHSLTHSLTYFTPWRTGAKRQPIARTLT